MKLNIPSTFHAGETLKFSQELENYKPSEGWGLEVSITNGTVRYSVIGTVDLTLDLWNFEVLPTETADYIPSNYKVFARVVKGSEVYVVDVKQEITIKADPFSGNGLNDLTFNERMVELLQQALLEDAPENVQKLMIGTRQLEKYSQKEKQALLDKYLNLVALDKLKAEQNSEYGAGFIYLRG